jgi:hypothetical protein
LLLGVKTSVVVVIVVGCMVRLAGATTWSGVLAAGGVGSGAGGGGVTTTAAGAGGGGRGVFPSVSAGNGGGAVLLGAGVAFCAVNQTVAVIKSTAVTGRTFMA